MDTDTAQHRQIGIAMLIDSHGRFLLQQRDDIPGIVHPGKIGLFGGHREGEETYLQCAVREIHEEIGYFVEPDHFKHFVSYDEVDDHGIHVHGEIFVANQIPVEELLITFASRRTGGRSRHSGKFFAIRAVCNQQVFDE